MMHTQPRFYKHIKEILILDFRRAEFGLLRELAGVIPGTTALGKSTGELLYLRGKPPRSTRMIHLMSRKQSRRGRRLTWLNVESLAELKHKKNVNRRWMRGQPAQEH